MKYEPPSRSNWPNCFSKGVQYFSHTRSGFPLFLPILSHIPVQARGNDKTIFNVNVMLNLRHHVAPQRIQDFLDVFSGFSIIK